MNARLLVASLAAIVASSLFAPSRAHADGGLTATAQTQIFTTDGESTALPELGLGYDLGPKSSSVPVRVNIGVRDAFATGPNGPNIFSAGVTARLTTPFYFGAGASIDVVSAPQQSFALTPGTVLPIGGYAAPSSTSNSGVGGTFFVGQQLVKTANFKLAIEAGYRFLPSIDDEPNSGADLGFRFAFR